MLKVSHPNTKYHHIANVVLAAQLGSNPAELAAEVRRRCPDGVYEPVRICEDMKRIQGRRGVFAPRNIRFTDDEVWRVRQLEDDMKLRGTWLTRGRKR
jgi:hypothetical protein